MHKPYTVADRVVTVYIWTLEKAVIFVETHKTMNILRGYFLGFTNYYVYILTCVSFVGCFATGALQ